MATDWVVPAMTPVGPLFPMGPEVMFEEGSLDGEEFESSSDVARSAKGVSQLDKRSSPPEEAHEPDATIDRDVEIEYLRTVNERRGRLLRMVERMTQKSEDAEDLLQDALMRAYRALPRFRGEARMSTWLTAIVQNSARDYLRSRRARVFVPIEFTSKDEDELVTLDLVDPRESPEESVERTELEGILRAEIRQLSPVCRQAIELCVLQGLPHETAAAKLDLSLSSIKSGVFRGKQILSQTVAKRVGQWKNAKGLNGPAVAAAL